MGSHVPIHAVVGKHKTTDSCADMNATQSDADQTGLLHASAMKHDHFLGGEEENVVLTSYNVCVTNHWSVSTD